MDYAYTSWKERKAEFFGHIKFFTSRLMYWRVSKSTLSNSSMNSETSSFWVKYKGWGKLAQFIRWITIPPDFRETLERSMLFKSNFLGQRIIGCWKPDSNNEKVEVGVLRTVENQHKLPIELSNIWIFFNFRQWDYWTRILVRLRWYQLSHQGKQ